jgi:hypothetical protein
VVVVVAVAVPVTAAEAVVHLLVVAALLGFLGLGPGTAQL